VRSICGESDGDLPRYDNILCIDAHRVWQWWPNVKLTEGVRREMVMWMKRSGLSAHTSV